MNFVLSKFCEWLYVDMCVIIGHYYKNHIIYVAGFGKMCTVHTSDFEHLEMHKNHRQWCTGLKLSGMIKE